MPQVAGLGLERMRETLIEHLCGNDAVAPTKWNPMQTRFRRYDTDGDGVLNLKEVEEMMRNVGFKTDMANSPSPAAAPLSKSAHSPRTPPCLSEVMHQACWRCSARLIGKAPPSPCVATVFALPRHCLSSRSAGT